MKNMLIYFSRRYESDILSYVALVTLSRTKKWFLFLTAFFFIAGRQLSAERAAAAVAAAAAAGRRPAAAAGAAADPGEGEHDQEAARVQHPLQVQGPRPQKHVWGERFSFFLSLVK